MKRTFMIGAYAYGAILAALVLTDACPAHAQGRIVVSSSQPALSPADAVAVLTGGPGLANRTYAPDPWLPAGPLVASTGAQGPSLGPWDFPQPTPARRLDGTLLSEPAQVYGWNPTYGIVIVPGGHSRGNRPVFGVPSRHTESQNRPPKP